MLPSYRRTVLGMVHSCKLHHGFLPDIDLHLLSQSLVLRLVHEGWCMTLRALQWLQKHSSQAADLGQNQVASWPPAMTR